jgi:L-lactate dehydrogenase complex protein LldG
MEGAASSQEEAFMSARDDILANVRRSLGVSGTDAPRRASVDARLASHARGIAPQRGQGDGAARLKMFVEQAQMVATSFAHAANVVEAPALIAEFLRAHNLPARLRMGEDARLRDLPWDGASIEISHGASAGDDLNSVSFAEAGVAETGTLALVSGAHNPTTLNFLPDNHIVILRACDIEADYESVWARLRERYGAGLMPRTVNLVTGPSRSADIEQKLLLGAHGPRRLHVVIVGD